MVDKNGKPDIQAALAALKDGFARKIPARVDEIRQSWKKLKSTPEDPDIFHLLHRQAHTLAGTAATYGFEETGRIAGAMEITLQDELTEDHTIWTATAVDKVGALLVQLESVAGAAGRLKRSDVDSRITQGVEIASRQAVASHFVVKEIDPHPFPGLLDQSRL